ncbi:MAG TPA: pyridoxamine 5'-phosphate oxidase family protein [Dermatophilaceae bacterium]|nr:pyridoxamine 5'-phosphate oxidase family protein [Dermatophilaceae bacterium]
MSEQQTDTVTPDVVAEPGDQSETEPVTDHRGLRVLTLEECLDKIRSATIGRVAFAKDGEVVILPVNHIVDGLDVVFRTTWGSKLQVAADGGQVAFEVDGLGEVAATGWSVLVQGTALIVEDQRDRRRFERSAPRPWVRDDGISYWVLIRPTQVTGREIIRSAKTE